LPGSEANKHGHDRTGHGEARQTLAELPPAGAASNGISVLLAGLGGSLTNFGGVWLAGRNACRLIRDWVPARTHQDLMDDLYGVMSCPRADDDRDGDHLAASLGWLVCLRRDGAAASVA
jgi:hypothetical protein